MTSRSTRSNQLLVANASNPENIIRKTQEPESYVTAWKPTAQQLKTTEMCTQPSAEPNKPKVAIEQSMEVPKGVRFRFELHSLQVIKPSFIGATLKNKEMVKGTIKALAKAFKLGFQAANKATEAFPRFLQIAQMNMIYQEIRNIKLMKIFDLQSHSGAFMNTLARRDLGIQLQGSSQLSRRILRLIRK